MTISFNPSTVVFKSYNGAPVIDYEVVISADSYYFTGFTSLPSAPFTVKDYVDSIHIHEGFVFEDGVDYYYDDTNKTITTTITGIILGTGNASGQLVVSLSSLIIISLNNGVNMELTGIYEEGVRYFYGTNGSIVTGDDPSATDLYYGTGNADGMIDLNINLLEILMAIGDLSIVDVPDTMALDTPTTVTWSADTLETVNIYADEVLVRNAVDATLGTYDITLDSGDFSVGDTPVISFRSVSGVVLDSEEIEVVSGGIAKPYLMMGSTELRLADSIDDSSPQLITTTLLDGNPHTAVWDGEYIYLTQKTSSTVITLYKKDIDGNTIDSTTIACDASQSFTPLYERGDYLYFFSCDGGTLQDVRLRTITKSDLSIAYTDIKTLFPANKHALARGENAGLIARGSSGYVLSSADFSAGNNGALYLNEAKDTITILTETWTHSTPVNVAWVDSESEYWVYVPGSGTIYKYDSSGSYVGTASTSTGYTFGANTLIQNAGSVKEMSGLTTETVNTASWVTNGIMRAWEEE